MILLIHDSMHNLKNRYPNDIYLMSGLHPTDVKENYKDELDFVVNSLKLTIMLQLEKLELIYIGIKLI